MTEFVFLICVGVIVLVDICLVALYIKLIRDERKGGE